MRIKQKLVLGLAFSVILPVLIISVFTISHTREQAYQSFIDASGREILQIDRAFSVFFESIEQNVTYLATTATVRDTSEKITSFMAPDPKFTHHKDQGPVEARMFEIYEKFGESHPDLAYVYGGREDGGYVAWPFVAMGDSSYDPRQRPWYKKAIENPGKTVRTDAYYWAGDDATYVGTVRTVTADNGTVIGVQAMDVSVKKLTNIVQEIKLGDAGYMMLIEDNGNVLVDPIKPENNFKKASNLPEPMFQALLNTHSGTLTFERDGETFLANVFESPALGWKFVGVIPESEVFAAANQQVFLIVTVAVVMSAIFVLLGTVFAKMITKPINQMSDALEEISQGEGDLTMRIHVDTKDEVGELAGNFNRFVARLQEIIGEVVRLSDELNAVSQITADRARNSLAEVEEQLSEVTAVATAMEELSTATLEIASNSEQTSSAAQDSVASSEQGQQTVQSSQQSIDRLAGEVTTAATVINELETHTQQISTILGTIQGIAEQTNLLALNAAIEAARAGDHGRGFAVVADEVRTLSQRTNESTEEIQNMIQMLQTTSKNAVSLMETSKGLADDSVSQAEAAYNRLVDITGSVNNIRDMAAQIAAATEEQSIVYNDISENANRIRLISDQLTVDANDRLERSAVLAGLSSGLHKQVGQFKI